MVRYFINYEDCIEGKNINEIDLYYLKLFNKRKNKKGLYTFVPITNEFEIYNQITKNNNKKNLMIEVFEEDLNSYNHLLIREYDEQDNGLYKKTIHDKDECIKLLNFFTLLNMKIDEIKKGDIVVLEPCISDERYLYLSSLRLKNNKISERRNEVVNKTLGADIYFYTTDEELLEKYEGGIVELKEIECNKYKILKNEIYVLDALKNNDLVGFDDINYSYLNIISFNLIPVYLTESYNGYNISFENENYGTKKYLVTSPDIVKILNNSELYPLLKFINLYKLKDGVYEKTSVVNVLNTNVLKYKRVDKK